MSIAEKFEVIADAVYDKGLFDECDKLTNAITDNGTRHNYMYAFANTDYSGVEFSKTITPDYYINHMFHNCSNMTELPRPLDFSKILETASDNYAYRRSVFAYCNKLETIPNLNMRAIGGLEEWFVQCRKLHTIELLRVKRETIYTSTFAQCDSLENITFDGEIGQSISFKDSPLLSIESQINIIKHLVDFSGTSDAGTRILTIHANAWEKLNVFCTPSEAGIDFDGSWISYVESLGWSM